MFLRDTFISRVGVALTMCRMISYCFSFLFGFNCIFQLNSSGFSILWYGYRYRATLWTGQLHPITVCRTVVLGVRWSCVECHYVFLLLIPSQSAISSWWLRLLLGFYVHCIYSELHLMLFETRLLWFYNNVPPLDVSSPGYYRWVMMTSSNGNFFRVTGLLCREFTGPPVNSRTKASDAELWSFLWSAPE